LIAYRRMTESYIDRVAEAPFETRVGSGFKLVVFRNRLDNIEHAALVKGEIKPDQSTLVRVHRVDFAADVIGGMGARAGLIDRSIAEIDKEGAGVLVLLREFEQDWLSKRLSGQGPTPEESQADANRVIGVGSQILRELGVRRMTVLANTPTKLVGLEGYGLSVDGWRGFKS
ncbi:MAG: 3,4-dihydroxy-2-butanone-4-phosphate synthase, partial [Hyphomonadaceae bacterium]